MSGNSPLRPCSHGVDFIGLDLREEYMEDKLVPTNNLKEVQIRPESFQITKLDTFVMKTK